MPRRAKTDFTPIPQTPLWEWFSLYPLFGYMLIILLTLVVYWPALNAGFIWDDNGHVTAPHLVSPGGLARIWFDIGATQQYYPLLHSAFWLEFHLWGDSALGYHLVNVVQHAIAACLFALLLRRLSIRGSWLAAFLFVLHPVCVESVAWVTEQKNTLSTILYLSAALAYLRFEQDRRPMRYAVATFLFLLALFSKTVTASLPAALLVIFWWSHGKLEWRKDVRPLSPWFALSLCAGILSAWVEHSLIGAQGAAFALSALDRCILAGRVFWFYLGKLLCPINLIFIYPRWTIDAGEVWQGLPLLAAVMALAVAVWTARRSRTPLAVLLLFGGGLFPVLGFVNVYPFKFSYVADHFQYLASLSIFALVAAGLTKAAMLIPRWISGGGVLAVSLMLGTLTWQQTKIYRDVFTLYESVLEKNPTCWMAHTNLAVAFFNAGRVSEALSQVQESLRLHPDSAEAENNCGSYLAQLDRPQEAISHYERALALQPRYPQALSNLGIALVELENFPQAIASLKSALAIDPGLPVTHCNLGIALARSGHLEEAITYFQKAVQLNPKYAEAEFKWGTALMFSDRFSEAEVHFEQALKLDSNSVEYHTLFADALAKYGQLDDAIVHFRKALELAPGSSDAHMNLALALRQSGQLQEAAAQYQEALRLKAAGP